MRVSRSSLFPQIEPLLPLVEKPSRYIDHEWGAVRDREADFRVCLIYPDTYEVGLPNLGLSILYNVLNAQEGIACERSFLPWIDMADLMRERGVPLASLESAFPVSSFDVVGFTIAHELASTNILEALDLAGIPLRSEDRSEDDPIVIGGGPSVYNSEPVAPIFDAILLGDGEEAIVEMTRTIKDGREAGDSRSRIVRSLSRLQGVYVPSLYDVIVDENSTEWGYAVPKEGSDVPEVVVRRCVGDFAATDPLASTIIPYVHVVHDRLAIEVLRGCARGCRFCQAGITYRPVRERPVDQVVSAASRGLERTGYDEVSLTSLSTTDHSCCAEMMHRLNSRFGGEGVTVSIPSQRLDSFGVDMALEASSGKKGGLTFAPEAGTQRLRDVINKNVSEQDIQTAARNAFEAGWRRMKLYFMMGLPTETDADVAAIPGVAEGMLGIGRSVIPKGERGGLGVSISVAVFVPKAWTPFQWCGQLDFDDVRRRQRLLVSSAQDRSVKVSYHDAKSSVLDAVLSRVGRRGFDLIYAAWRRGCRFDAWTEQFRFEEWRAAADDVGMDLHRIAREPYPTDARLPWDHTSPGVSKGFLLREWRRANAAVTTPDCTRTSCTGCGICQAVGADNSLVGER